MKEEQKEWKGKFFTDKDTITPENTPEVDHVVKVSDLPKGSAPKQKQKPSAKKRKRDGKWRAKSFFLLLLVIVLCAGAALAAGFVTAFCNSEGFSLSRHWPVCATAFVIFFCTTGFFSSHDNHEWLYGAFSLIGVVCFVAELVLMFH